MSSAPNAQNGDVIVQVFGRTDVGRTREHNEDAFVVADLSANNATLQPEVRTHTIGPKGSLFMVADGMGGAAAGEIASAMAVDVVLNALRATWVNDLSGGSEAFVRAIKQATKAANEQINSYALSHPEYRGMGTTATVAGLLGDTLYLAQVGDSRAYLVRDGVARQITKDQSLMQKLIEAGELTEEEAEHSERRNIILQALGPEPTIKVDLTHQVVRRGDTLVLCSDGLSGQVGKDEIAAVVSEETDLTIACRRLIDRANENGGPDNITVIVVRFEGAGLVGAAAEDEIGHRVFQLPETGQTPAVSFDRVMESDAPTKPIPIVERPRSSAATPPVRDESLIVTGETEVPVSPGRRSTGRVIAIALLIALVAGAVWFVAHQLNSHVAIPNAPNAGPLMPIELRILSGARAGQGETFEKSVIAVGRHPMSDFRFDPSQDLDVSTRHGEIRCVSGRYSIFDSNSTNGTFVNGQRVPPGGMVELSNNDVIAFGVHGPTVSVGVSGPPSAPIISRPSTEPRMAQRSAPPPSGTPPSQTERPSGSRRRRNTAERVAIAVREQTRRLWIAMVVVIVVLGGTAATLFIRSSRQAEASRVAMTKLLEANEAITKSFQDRLRQGDTALANRMRHINDSLVLALRQAKSTAQMADAEAALRRHNDLQRQITEMDFSTISTANDAAVVLIASDMGGSAPHEATGFCVRSDGLIVTNRHVVADSTGRATSIRVRFANSGRTYHARISKLAESANTDLALLQIDESGKFPTVAKLGTSVDMPVGAPVATIGFPLGTDLPMDGSAAKTTATFGKVSKVVPDLLQIDAFATYGSSGTPVFDAHGHVVGIVYGGVSDRIVFSVPVDRLNELLRGVK